MKLKREHKENEEKKLKGLQTGGKKERKETKKKEKKKRLAMNETSKKEEQAEDNTGNEFAETGRNERRKYLRKIVVRRVGGRIRNRRT